MARFARNAFPPNLVAMPRRLTLGGAWASVLVWRGLEGQQCLDATASSCGCAAASCPLPCQCVPSVGGGRRCFSGGLFICDSLPPCTSDSDCPGGSARQVTCSGAVFCGS